MLAHVQGNSVLVIEELHHFRKEIENGIQDFHMEGAIVDLGSRRFPRMFFGKSIAFF